MVLFKPVLLRLKEQLGVSTDKEVAAILGLSPAAFYDRKKREAFPEDKLLALVARQPELDLDVAYILTGESARAHAVMGAVRAATEIVDRLGGTKAERQARADVLLAGVVNASRSNLSDEEKMLLGRYRDASRQVKDEALRVLLGETPPPKPQRQTKFSIGSVNGTVVEGGQVNNGPVSFGKTTHKKE